MVDVYGGGCVVPHFSVWQKTHVFFLVYSLYILSRQWLKNYVLENATTVSVSMNRPTEYFRPTTSDRWDAENRCV